MLKEILKHIYINKIKILLLTIMTFLLLFVGTNFVKQQTTTLIVSLKYENASDGLNPNGSKFNIFKIKSEEVLSKTLKATNLEDKYDIKDFEKDIEISLTSNSNNNLPTTYKITYNKNCRNLGMSSEEIVKNLYKSYKEVFTDEYSYNNDILTYEIQDFSENEYLYIVENLKLNTTRISNYLNDRLKENNTFRDENNYSFQDLKQNVDNLLNISISNLESYIQENGIAKDSNDTKELLLYKNELLNITYKKMILGYETRKEGINFYDSDMSSIVLVPSLDENNDYYMSKTKTGIDYLANDSNYYLSESEWYKATINKNKNMVNNLNKNNTTETRNKTEKMIESIQESLNVITNQITNFDNEYMAYKNKNYMSYKIEKNNISKKSIMLILIISILFTLFIESIFLIKRKFNLIDIKTFISSKKGKIFKC